MFEKMYQVEKKGQGKDGWQMVSKFSAALMDRRGELRDALTGLSPKADGREVTWVQGSGAVRGAVASKPTYLVSRAFCSPSAHTFDGEASGAQASGPSLALCLAWARCLPRQRPEAPSSAGQPVKPGMGLMLPQKEKGFDLSVPYMIRNLQPSFPLIVFKSWTYYLIPV